jgi:hypothetical protein
MSVQEFPKMLYRAEGAAVVHFVVTTQAALDAAMAEGWGDRRAAVAEAAKAPTPVAAAKPDAANSKEMLALIEKLNAAQGSMASKDEMIVAKDNVIQAQGDQILALQEFIAGVGEDPNCPPALKEAIDALLGGDEKAAKPAKKAGKAKA